MSRPPTAWCCRGNPATVRQSITRFYRYIENNKNKPFVLIDTVDASESPSGEYAYQLKDLASNEEYQYTITSGYYTSKEESVQSEIVVG